MAPNLPLDLWLMWVVYGGIPFSPDDSYTLAMSGALEMLRTGCTAVLDHAWVPADGFDDHVEAMASAYTDAGIRCGLAPMIQDRDIFESMAFGDGDAPPPLGEPVDPAVLLASMERYLTDYGARPRFTPIVGPSAPQRCSDDLMVGLTRLAHTHGAPLHTHVLETRSQVVATRVRYGRSVVEYLDDIGALTDRTSLAHGVWMDSDDFALVRAAGATVVHCPISNLRCGSGLLPLASLLDGGVSVALGADGAASNDNQNMFEAMKFAALIHTTSPFCVADTRSRLADVPQRRSERAARPDRSDRAIGNRATSCCSTPSVTPASIAMRSCAAWCSPNTASQCTPCSSTARSSSTTTPPSRPRTTIGRRSVNSSSGSTNRSRSARRCSTGTDRCSSRSTIATLHWCRMDDAMWLDNTHPMLRRCWHPVARLEELADGGPLAVELLGEHWCVARLDGQLAASRTSARTGSHR